MFQVNNFKTFAEKKNEIPEKMQGYILRNLYIIRDNYGEDAMVDDPFKAYPSVDGGANVIIRTPEDLDEFIDLTGIDVAYPEDMTLSKKNDVVSALYITNNDFGVEIFMGCELFEKVKSRFASFGTQPNITCFDKRKVTLEDGREITDQEYLDEALKRYKEEFKA